MLLMTIGGDMRYAYLTSLAAAQSMEITSVGLERCPMELPSAALDDIAGADAVILPNPWRNGLSIPFSEYAFTLNDVLSRLNPGTAVLLSDISGMPDGAVPNAVDLSADPRYILKNAHLTAESALSCAAGRMNRAFMDSRCLIIGYGRIGRRLAVLISALGATVTAAARRKEARALALEDGVSAVPMEELSAILPGMDCIFSTVPAPVLPGSLLRLVRPDALLMDLASPPYGFDLDEAISLSLCACRENGLPGRACPLSAGMALLDAVKDALFNRPEGGIPCVCPTAI